MAGLFLAILSMSLTGSAVILAVLLARVCLRRAPKKVTYLLWIPVAFRLICPVSFSSPLSLFRLPVLNAASEATHISAALTENIDSYDDWASAGEPAQPLDTAAPSDKPAAPVPAEPVGMPEDMNSGSPDAAAEQDGLIPDTPTGEVPLPEQVPDRPVEQSSGEEMPAAVPVTAEPDPVWENPAPVTEFPPVTQTIPSGDDGTPAPTPAENAEPASDPELSVQPDGNVEETPDLPLPDSSEESMTFLDRIMGIRTRILTTLSAVWLAGVAVLLLYGVGSSIAIRRMMDTAVWLEDNIWESDRMGSPFILGLIRPKIYIPFGLEGDCRRYVLAHERYHLRCRDDLSKAAGWLILAVHWFNPLVWLAFRLMSRDMEMRCDEAVLSGEEGIAKAYSMSLLSFASEQQIRFPASPAFGEGDVESRIRRILDWKKPKTWVTVPAVVLVLAVILVCTSDPVTATPAAIGEPQTETGPEREGDSKPPESLETDFYAPPEEEPPEEEPLGELPAGDWTPLAAELENILYSTGGWMVNPMQSPGSLSAYVSGMWNGWYREDGAFCTTSLRLAPYTRESFRWTGSSDWNGMLGAETYDFRGTYRIGEDGLLRAQFGVGADAEIQPYEAVFRIRYDAAHTYGTEYRETLGVTLVSCTAPGFDAWIGRELPMTGAAWFRGDLDGDPADAIRKMTPSDREAEFFPDTPVFPLDCAGLSGGETLVVLYPSSYDAEGNFRRDPDAPSAPDAVTVSVFDLDDLCFYAENEGRRSGEDHDSFILTSFRWQGKWFGLPRPLSFQPYWFSLVRADDLAFFSSEPPSGPDAEQLLVLLTADGAYCFDNEEAGAGYLLSLYTEEDGKSVAWSRVNADFLNMQTSEELLRFRGREDDPLSESGSLRYDGDGRFVFTSEERLTGSERFEAQKKTEPERYPEDTFGAMTFREYLAGFLPREIRDNTLRAKGLFTPEEAENLAAYLIETMMHQDWLEEGFIFTEKEVSTFIMRIGMMQANAAHVKVPETLTALWGGVDGSYGIFRANAYRVAREMFGLFPDDPSVFANEIFAYNEAKDCYEVVFPTGLPHGYFDYEDMSTVWDDISVTVRFRLVSYQYDPAEDNGHTNLSFYSDERIDCGEYRLIFYKTSGLYTNELPRIRFEKRGEIEPDNTPEPPVSDEVKAAIVYPDFFDGEQRDLYARALVLFPAVWGTSGSYIEDAFSRKDGEPFMSGRACPAVTIYDPESGYDLYYHICRGRYENWADFDAAGRALFTAELWESITGPGKRCAEYGGKTCVLDADAGGNGYDPTLDRFELVEKTEDRIVYWFITSNRARGTFEIESSERTLVTMVKTAEGWRFGSFRVGTWLPAGTEAERMTVHVNTPEEAESLVRLLVRGVMDDTWLAGRIAYTPADALYLTQGLKTAFTDTTFPFREAASHDGMTWGIHADHIRNAVRELFGIRDFDYFAAAREVYGEDASVSASIDGMGFISFPADIGDHTTKFDVSELYSYEEDGVVRVFAHIVNASDYPWDEADYGIYRFTFAPNFDGPGLTVEKPAVQWSRGKVEAEIARLTEQRTIAVNDMNNASARNVEIETEIHRLRSVLEDESSPGDDRRAAVQRLEDLEPLREQQYALAEQCLNVVKQFAARIRMYEMILAEMDGGSYTDDPLSARLRGLTAEDILYLTSTFDHITTEELAQILNRTGILDVQPAPEDFRAYYTLDVYLSETPSGGFGSESETLTLFAGLEVDLVRIRWSGEGAHRAEERFVRDAALYRILRENYRLTEQIDEYAYEKWGEAAREHAVRTVENALGMDGRPAFTDYRIIGFVLADSFERDGAQYTVCSWQPVFLTDDPDNVVWAGGMGLDADGEVFNVETETYYAVKETQSGQWIRFFEWTLYTGPDEETRLAWGRDRVVEAFERLENGDSGEGGKNAEEIPSLLPPDAEKTASSLDELSNLGMDETYARLAYVRAFVTGDVDRLEEVCGVERGMYEAYRTLELSSWAVWIDPDEAWGPLHFAFVPARSDVEAFPADTRIEGTVYENLMGAYFDRSNDSPSFGEAADELYELLSRHILLELPTTDEMDAPTRFALTCYICGKLGDADLSEESYRTYAEKHFGIENFTPDGGHVGHHGGHGGSRQILDVVASEEKDGETVVTVQYYADWSKTVNSGTWQYAMRKTDDGWCFTNSEEIRHSDYGRAMQVM